MRDWRQDDSPEAEGVAHWLSILWRWTSAALSLALVGALVLWGVRLGLRDAGEVPVIRAMEAPARVAPAEPGGEAAAHTGLEVNEILAGETAGAPEESALAPPPPDLPETVAPAPLEREAPETETGAAEAEPSEPVDESAAIDALVREALGGEGAAAPPRPRPRPEDLAENAPPASRAGLDAAALAEPVVSEMPPGTLTVQLGAYESLREAQGAWARLTALHDDLLSGRQGYVEEASTNGLTFFRLRALGFGGGAEQDGLCEALRARDVPCIPVTVR